MTHEQTVYFFIELAGSLLIYIFVIQFVRRRIWIIITTLASCCVMLPFLISLFSFHFYSWFYLHFLSIGDHPDGLTTAFLSLPSFAATIVGAFLARALISRIGHSRSVYVCGFIFLWIITTGYEMAALEVHTAQPSKSCLQSELYLSLGETKVSVPANPAMILNTGENSIWTVYPSLYEFPMKELCRRAGKEKNPLRLVNLIIYFPLIDDYLKDRSLQFSRLACDNTDNGQKDFLCESATFKPPYKRQLTGIQIFLPEKFTPSVTGAWHYRYEAFLEAKEAAAKAGTPWTAVPAGIFDRYPEGYYVAHDATLTDGGKNPITLHCDVSTPMGWFDCTTVRPLPDGLQGIVSFSTPITELDQTAISANQSAEKLLTLLSAPSQ